MSDLRQAASLSAREEEFADLLQRARNGEEESITELWTRYKEHILRVIRRFLTPVDRRLFDSFALAHEVWESLFAGSLVEEAFQSPEHFLRFLTITARNKTLVVSCQC